MTFPQPQAAERDAASSWLYEPGKAFFAWKRAGKDDQTSADALAHTMRGRDIPIEDAAGKRIGTASDFQSNGESITCVARWTQEPVTPPAKVVTPRCNVIGGKTTSILKLIVSAMDAKDTSRNLSAFSGGTVTEAFKTKHAKLIASCRAAGVSAEDAMITVAHEYLAQCREKGEPLALATYMGESREGLPLDLCQRIAAEQGYV